MNPESSKDYTWDRFETWDLVLPPSRPSRYHLRIVQKHLMSRNRDLPVAILGCTPEYRDMLNRLGYSHIYLFDKSEFIFGQMSKLTSFKSDEVFIKGDWLETLSDFDNFFDVILSDLTSGNLSYAKQPTFYDLISRSLSLTGLFIDKILTFPGPKKKLRRLEAKYSKLPVNLLYTNYFSCEFLFSSELLDINQTVDSTYFYNYLSDTFTSPVLKHFLRESPKITPYDTIWYYGKRWDEICPYYIAHIEPVIIYDDEQISPYYGNLKLIIGRKR